MSVVMKSFEKLVLSYLKDIYHESGCHSPHYSCTSPMDYNSHHSLHLRHTHSHPPLHQSHSCYQSLINPDCLTTPAPHSHTHIYKQHTSLHSPQSLVLAPADISEHYPSYRLLSLCLTPDCPTLELWTCACDPDFCLVLFTSLPCLWYSCFCPLTFACLILSIKYLTALGSTRLWPVITTSLDPLLFAYQANRSVDDAVSQHN